ncbi:amino acid adenylation domain-containing protein [Streptomyces sp. NPDC051776]|uniref:non-ribosomal peptide synthetase n=1 Tax=Streptomyces sp. NPDC051776 TaxID=3155414 RepID=UPI00343C520E
MNTTELLAQYERDDVHLWAEEGQLRYRAPRGYFTEERRAELLRHKQAVLEHLAHAEEHRTLRPDPDHRHEPFPLTDIQAAYLVGRADAYDYGAIACHAYVELNCPGLDPQRVTEVWNTLVERHDMLRAVVHPDGYQEVLPHTSATAVDVGVTEASAEDLDTAVLAVRARLSHRAGPTDRWPLFTVHLTRAPERAVLHLSFDMLTVDHASLRLLLTEIDLLYSGSATGLPPLTVGFRDYVLARRALMETPRYDRDRAYWRSRLEDLPPAPELPTAEGWAAPTDVGDPTDRTAPVRFDRLERLLPARTAELLTNRAQERGLTPSAVLLVAYAETVGRWVRVPRFTLNVPTVERLPLHQDIEHIVGDFTTMELLAVDLTEPVCFAERVRRISDQLLKDLEHSLFTGSEVLAELSHRAGAPVLMPVVFTSALGTGRPSGGNAPQVRYAATQTPQVWIDCQVMRRGDTLALSWDVRDGVLPSGLAEAMFTGWVALVEHLAADEEAWEQPARVELPGEQAERRTRANDTSRPLPDTLLHEPVITSALTTPDTVAVDSPDRTLTYRQLVARAAELSERLVGSGLRRAEPVAIWMDKGWEQVVAVLGTLLAGGAYVPVDTAQPTARRDTILADAGARTVLSQSWLLEHGDLPDALTMLAVDELPESTDPVGPAERRADPDDLAYVIYTSGSTGTPKGVMVSHRAAGNTIQDINRRHRMTPEDRALGLAGLGFDLSVYDLFGPLSAGGVLVLPEAARRGDPSHWADIIARSGITVWNSVPGQLHMLCDWLRSAPPQDENTLRLALLSGDWIPVTLPDEARTTFPRLHIEALGGATEGAIWSIAHPVTEVDTTRPSIPYGRPLANQGFHVLDHAMRPCPDWVPGELYIAGAGVALGYLNDPQRTAERFLTHPETGERIYRTGDLGRYLPSGDIEFLGREDAQVKIRGYRVELAEVEAAVQSHPAVGSGAVVVDDSPAGGRRLAAFVEPARRDGGGDATRGVADVHDAAARAIRDASGDLDATALTAFLDALDDVALAEMTRVLQAAGLFQDTTPTSEDEVIAALSAAPAHRHIVRRWLRALASRDRLIAGTLGTYGSLRPVSKSDLERAWQHATELEGRVGWSTVLLDVMRTCAGRLPELLAGHVDIRALLFPGAGLEAADAAYRDNLAIRHLNHAIVNAVSAMAAQHTGEERLRILEVGGGVGGTTGQLVPVLAHHGVDYLFTDASPFFLNEARERFADHPWLRYERFDADEDIRSQGLAPHSFDVVICANTLHAVSDAEAALGRLRELLVPGGHLVFVENTRDVHPPLLVSMEFLEVAGRTWTDLRADSCQSFLTRPQWLDLLDRYGATDVCVLPDRDDALAATGQELFLARLKTDRVHTSTGELARHAATRLPEYMVPSHWQVVDALPRTANGKTDRAQLLAWLPSEAAQPQGPAETAPMDELESRLAELWASLMSVETIGRDDDFFALGGDSLLVARMVGQLRERIPQAAHLEWEVVLRHMLRRPTVAGLAEFLRDLTGAQAREQSHDTPPSPVVHLHGGGPPEEPTTVLVHAGTGTVMPYRALITEIRRRCPGLANVVGLEVPDLDAYLEAPPEGLIEQLAADYARALLGDGCSRFHVVGYCLGGLIATEVARHLAEAGAEVASLTVISSHSPRFRLDDELLAEYSFAVMMGIDPADLGFPADGMGVAAAADAVLAGSPGVLPDGGIAALTDEHADVARCFRDLASVPRTTRTARMCEAVPASAGSFEPDHMTRLFLAFRQSVFAITRYDAEPYAGDITFLRHSGAYPFPGSKAAVTTYWEELALGELSIVDIAGDHFSCLSVDHAPAVLKLLEELTDGEVSR